MFSAEWKFQIVSVIAVGVIYVRSGSEIYQRVGPMTNKGRIFGSLLLTIDYLEEDCFIEGGIIYPNLEERNYEELTIVYDNHVHDNKEILYDSATSRDALFFCCFDYETFVPGVISLEKLL